MRHVPDRSLQYPHKNCSLLGKVHPTNHHSLSLNVQFVFSQFSCPPIQSVISLLGCENILADNIESLEKEKHIYYCPVIWKFKYFVMQSSQASQGWFTNHESLLTMPNHLRHQIFVTKKKKNLFNHPFCLVLCLPFQCFLEHNIVSIPPANWGRAGENVNGVVMVNVIFQQHVDSFVSRTMIFMGGWVHMES